MLTHASSAVPCLPGIPVMRRQGEVGGVVKDGCCAQIKLAAVNAGQADLLDGKVVLADACWALLHLFKESQDTSEQQEPGIGDWATSCCGLRADQAGAADAGQADPLERRGGADGRVLGAVIPVRRHQRQDPGGHPGRRVPPPGRAAAVRACCLAKAAPALGHVAVVGWKEPGWQAESSYLIEVSLLLCAPAALLSTCHWLCGSCWLEVSLAGKESWNLLLEMLLLCAPAALPCTCHWL